MTSSHELPTSDRPLTIACTLPPDRIPDQLAEWAALRHAASDVRAIDGGVRLTLPADREATARDLAEREQGCCSFLRIAVVRGDGDCSIEVTSEHPDAAAVIALIAGSALRTD